MFSEGPLDGGVRMAFAAYRNPSIHTLYTRTFHHVFDIENFVHREVIVSLELLYKERIDLVT